MEKVDDIISSKLHKNGFITIDKFMEILLSSTNYSYYRQHIPIGEKADFITAPEISNMFGHIIGAWVVDSVMKFQSSNIINLVELGPGKGTLIYNILQIISLIPDIYNKVVCHLVEISEPLKKLQKLKLKKYSEKVFWHQELNIQNDYPMIIIANEFFDALPIKQYIKKYNVFKERTILGEIGNLYFGDIPTNKIFSDYVNIGEGGIIENSEQSISLIGKIAEYLKTNRGCCLFVDYGYYVNPKKRKITEYNETLQAIGAHQYSDILHNLGQVDLSAHVDFFALKQVLTSYNISNIHIVKQKDFLNIYGIEQRYDFLVKEFPNKIDILKRQKDYLTKKMDNFFILSAEFVG